MLWSPSQIRGSHQPPQQASMTALEQQNACKKIQPSFLSQQPRLCTEAVFQLCWKGLVLKVCLITLAIKRRIWLSILLKTLLLTSTGS